MTVALTSCSQFSTMDFAQSLAIEALDALGLTPAEARVLIAIADGASLAEASASLGISKNTVRSHLQHIFIKTGVTRKSELVILASKLSFAYCGPSRAGQLQ